MLFSRWLRSSAEMSVGEVEYLVVGNYEGIQFAPEGIRFSIPQNGITECSSFSPINTPSLQFSHCSFVKFSRIRLR